MTYSKMAEGCGNAICGEATDYDGFTITCLKQSLRELCKKGEDQDDIKVEDGSQLKSGISGTVPTKEFTSMEFYMFGAGMLFLGVLLGVVGIAVYKSQVNLQPLHRLF